MISFLTYATGDHGLLLRGQPGDHLVMELQISPTAFTPVTSLKPHCAVNAKTHNAAIEEPRANLWLLTVPQGLQVGDPRRGGQSTSVTLHFPPLPHVRAARG